MSNEFPLTIFDLKKDEIYISSKSEVMVMRTETGIKVHSHDEEWIDFDIMIGERFKKMEF